jgi:hypothetical protein
MAAPPARLVRQLDLENLSGITRWQTVSATRGMPTSGDHSEAEPQISRKMPRLRSALLYECAGHIHQV